MKTVFCICAFLIAVVYYVGAQKEMEAIDTGMNETMKILYALTGRTEEGTFTRIEEVPEEEIQNECRDILKYDNPNEYRIVS